MKKECKTARNTVGIAMLIMAALLITLQSCSSSRASCDGYQWNSANSCPAYR